MPVLGRRVTSPLPSERRRRERQRRTTIAQEEAQKERAQRAKGRAAGEETKRMGIRAGVGTALAGRPGADPAAAMKMISGRPSPVDVARAPRMTTRQRYLKTQLGIPVGTAGEGAARRKAYGAMQAGLQASEMEYERTRTRPYLERLETLYKPYRKSPEGDIYHKGEMTMPRRSKLPGIRGMQYLHRPSIEQQYAADQAAAGVAGGGRTTQAPAPAAPATAPALSQDRAAIIGQMDQLSAQLQATTDPAAASGFIQQFDQLRMQLEQGMAPAAPAQAGPGPYTPGFQAFPVPGYTPGEIPPLGYEPTRAMTSDFMPLAGQPTRAQIRAAPMVAPPAGQEEVAAREAGRPLLMRPTAAGPAAAPGAPAVSPFGGPTAEEQVNVALARAQIGGLEEQTRTGAEARGTIAREVGTAKWAAIDTTCLTAPNVPWGADHVGNEDYLGVKRRYEDVKSRAQGPADAIAFLNQHGAAVRKAITVAAGAMGEPDVKQGYIAWLEKLLNEVEAIAAQPAGAAAPGAGAALPSGRTPPPAEPRHPGAW